MKTSKIIKVEMLEEWSNSNGTFYPHEVTFENGDKAIANKKNQNAYNIGQELNYELVGEDKVGNKKFKEVREENHSYKGGGGGKGMKGSNSSFALSYAKDIAVAKINNGAEANKDLMNDIIITAGIFNDWLNKN